MEVNLRDRNPQPFLVNNSIPSTDPVDALFPPTFTLHAPPTFAKVADMRLMATLVLSRTDPERVPDWLEQAGLRRLRLHYQNLDYGQICRRFLRFALKFQEKYGVRVKFHLVQPDRIGPSYRGDPCMRDGWHSMKVTRVFIKNQSVAPAIPAAVPSVGDDLILQPCRHLPGDASSYFHLYLSLCYPDTSFFQYALGVTSSSEQWNSEWVPVGAFYAFDANHQDIGFRLKSKVASPP